MDKSYLVQERERGMGSRRCLRCCLSPRSDIRLVVAHLLGAHRCMVQTDRYLQHRHGQGFLKPSHTSGLLAKTSGSAVLFFRKQRVVEGPPSALHVTPRQPEPLSSTVRLTSSPLFHTEDWKGNGGFELPSLLHHQHSAAEERGKAREWFVLGGEQGHTISSLKHLLKQGSIHGSQSYSLTPALYSQKCEGFSVSLQK